MEKSFFKLFIPIIMLACLTSGCASLGQALRKDARLRDDISMRRNLAGSSSSMLLNVYGRPNLVSTSYVGNTKVETWLYRYRVSNALQSYASDMTLTLINDVVDSTTYDPPRPIPQNMMVGFDALSR